jgi:hypothetical protein
LILFLLKWPSSLKADPIIEYHQLKGVFVELNAQCYVRSSGMFGHVGQGFRSDTEQGDF